MYEASLNSGYVTITVIRIYRYIAWRYFIFSIMDYIFLPALAAIAKHHLPTTIAVLPCLISCGFLTFQNISRGFGR